MRPPIVLSLYDRTGNMVRPWLEAGYECWIVDLQHEPGEHRDGNLVRVGGDLRTWLPPRRDYAAAFAFPPCTHLAVSGARWFKDKGLAALADGVGLVERASLICQWTEAPWMLENPMSTLSTYWREPDAIVHPWWFAGHGDDVNLENYTKATCLWTGNGFVVPGKSKPGPEPHNQKLIHHMPPSGWQGLGRANERSATPLGFARAVFKENHFVRVEAA